MEFILVEPDPTAVLPAHNKNSRKNKAVQDRDEYEKKELIWSLFKYRGEEVHDGVDWRPQGSSQKLNDQLTTVIIVDILNKNKAFDFEYGPAGDDYLSLKFKYVHKEIKNRDRPYIDDYISFLFKDGKWIINKGYDHLKKVYEDFKEGVCRITKYPELQ